MTSLRKDGDKNMKLTIEYNMINLLSLQQI